MDRRAEDEAVVVCGNVQKFVHPVLEDTLVLFCALAAAKTACQGLDAYPEEIRANAFLFQSPGHFHERGIGRALLVRTPVHKQNLHDILLQAWGLL